MKLNKAVLATFLSLSLVWGCCPSQKVAKRKIAKFTDCNPSLIEGKKDTVRVILRDTIFKDKISLRLDTILEHDTIFFENEQGVGVSLVRQMTGSPCDTAQIKLSVGVDCPPDTFFIEKPMDVEVQTGQINVMERDKTIWAKLQNWLVPFVLGIIGGVFLIFTVKKLY